MENEIKVLIVGGGFGGIYTTKELLKLLKKHRLRNVKVTLVSDKNYFLFTPMVHEVATGGLDDDNVVNPIRNIFNNENVNFVLDRITHIDFANKKAHTPSCTIDFDFIALSTGAKSDFYEITGAEGNVYPIKTLEDAKNIKKGLLECFENAKRTAILNDSPQEITFVVVGGGATGVEMTAEICEYAKGDLAHAYGIDPNLVHVVLLTRSGLIGDFNSKSQEIAEQYLTKLGVQVLKNRPINKISRAQNKEQNNEPGFEISYGALAEDEKPDTPLKANMIVWAVGVEPDFPKLQGTTSLSKEVSNERLKVKDTLQLINTDLNTDFAFALGDVAEGWEALAYTATHQAQTVSKNLIALIMQKELVPFVFAPKVRLLSLGGKNALGEIYGINISGRWVWFVWRTVYLFKVPSLKKQLEIAINWTFNLIKPRDIGGI